MKTYVKGDTYKNEQDDYKTFGITEFDSEAIVDKELAQKIEVYGDRELRDKIIGLLNSQEQNNNPPTCGYDCDECNNTFTGILYQDPPFLCPECKSKQNKAAPENLSETIDEPTCEYVGSDNLGPTDDQFTRFEKELECAINRTCMENGSNTPDFILAEYLVNCLKAFNKASRDRERWYGKELKI